MPRFLFLLALLVAVDAPAASFVLPLAPDSPRPEMIYSIRANDGAVTDIRQARVQAVSGFAEVETSGVLSPVANVMAMEFHFPAASFDLTIGAADQIPFSITIDATTERVENLQPPPHRLASFGLAFPGEETSSIDVVQVFQRVGFGFTLQSAGSVFPESGGADCESTGFPGCLGGTFTGTIDAFALTQLEFLGGAGGPNFALGTGGLGISWTVKLDTRYPLDSVGQPITFTPEPESGALLGLGLLVLGGVRRRSPGA
jgi:hypothetical protein